ncbi:IclR family transcriptional regulator [Pontibacillus salicampi]|uniref:IclR family transcriptional regulator n=1 Tax=Pontibacillus salicampi TaxID=1449801 RepID=A0ABV6LQJ8_9BACI
MEPNYEVKTLKKGLQILELIKAHGPRDLLHIQKELGFNKSTAYRLVTTLLDNGYLQKTASGGYALGAKAGSGSSYTPAENWKAVPPLFEISKDLEETAYIGILQDQQTVITQVADGAKSIRTHSYIGQVDAIHHSAIGKAILAFERKEKQESIIATLPLPPTTENTISNHDTFMKELNHIKEHGYALDNEESEIGLRCVGAPIFKDDQVIAAMAIAGPSSRITTNNLSIYIHRVMEGARQISNLF